MTQERAFRYVNRRVPRVDGYAKVTGEARYASDVELPRMAWGKVVRSPIAHGRIVSVDASAALARDGVIAVLTGADVAQLPQPYYGHAIADRTVLAIDRVRYAGEPVAVVVAEDERTAQLALAGVDVRYEDLPAVLDTESARRAGAPLVHERDYGQGAHTGVRGVVRASSQANICHQRRLEWGDTTAALAEAKYIVDATYVFGSSYAYAMEPYVAVSEYRDHGILCYTSAQHPFLVRSGLARVFALPLSAIRVVVPYVGGGYGSKTYSKIEPLVTAASWKARRPVKIQLSVEEAMLTACSAGATMHLRTGADAEGRLVVREAQLYFNGGAYAENAPVGADLAAMHVLGAYRFPSVRVDSYVVYTNTVPTSSYRGFSSTQPTFASESQIDELARAVGADVVAFRVKNALRRGDRVNPECARPLDGDLAHDVSRAAAAIGWGEPVAAGHGRGIGTMILAAGAFPASTAAVRVYTDGSVSVLTGSTELGQGTETVLSQLAAEELEVPIENVHVVRSDTDAVPFERSTAASRTTTLQGRALIAACRDAKARLRTMAAKALGVPENVLVEATGGVRHGDRFLGWGEIVQLHFGLADVHLTGQGEVRREGDFANDPAFWELCAVGVEASVDRDTGTVRIERLSTVADVGLAINPAMMETQDLGAAAMGMGHALYEELVYEGQQLANGSMLLYRVPRFSDMPKDVRLVLVESRDGPGPYGAKGGGEGPTSAMPAAVATAIERATGLRLRQLPFTPERVWRALRERDASSG